MLLRLATLLLTMLLLGVSALPGQLAADPPKDAPGKPKRTNRLARETSPYLLQHAHNPVDWFAWGPEAFAKAKKEGKLIFLSIGYSSCHWCHVMEKESFADDTVAEMLNQHFVCIKVDREERPDIDQIYMMALQVMDQRGGWPLSMFLTAEGKPIIGGTYWPREDKEIQGRKLRGFKSVLKLILDIHKEKPKEVNAQAEEIARLTTRALSGTPKSILPLDLKRDLLKGAVDLLSEQFDADKGGFGSPPDFEGTKFPTSPRLLFLEEETTRGSKEARRILSVTLDHMARGGIYDQLGGGFHRYSVERTWTVPHFEKMLYDNAQLVEVYALAWQRDKNPAYRRVIEETLAFVERELTSPEGAFYSALDADSEGEEGRFYVWTGNELTAQIPDNEDGKFFRQVYGLDQGPNFEGKYRILTLPLSLEDRARELKVAPDVLQKRLDPIRQKLLAARAKRVRPFLDTKVLTGWNGQMIAGLARAGQALGEKKYVERAIRASEFLLKRLKTSEGRLLRTYGAAPGGKAEARIPAYLDDYAYLVHGLLNLHEATGDKRWLTEARNLTETMRKYHHDDKNGAFFYTASDAEAFFVRGKDQYDGAQPCGNSQAVRNLVRLWITTGEATYKEQAESAFQSLAVPLKTNPGGLTTLVSAAGLYLDGPKK